MADNVLFDQIILRIEGPLGPRGQQQARRERVDSIGQWIEARFTGMLLGQTSKLLAEIGIIGVGKCVRCRFRVIEIDARTAIQKRESYD